MIELTVKIMFSFAAALLLATFSYLVIGLIGAAFIGIISFASILTLSIYSHYSGLRLHKLVPMKPAMKRAALKFSELELN